MKVFIVLALIFSSFPAFSASREYVPAFRKPASEKNSVVLQKGIQKDISRFYSLFFKESPLQVVENTAAQEENLFEGESASE